MKHLLFGVALATLVGSALAADVGVSVSVGQPGFYGRIDIGNVPQPQVIYAAPVIIQQAPIGLVRQPIYLRVRPGHEKHWDKNCHRYNACGQPVYFVNDNWYRNEYSASRRNEHGDHNNDRGDNGRGHEKMKKKHDQRGND
jgi:hypothetical protein